MMALTGDAVEAVAGAVRRGDGRLAMQLLKALGLATPQADGPVEPRGCGASGR
jgi:hypothetical protein